MTTASDSCALLCTGLASCCVCVSLRRAATRHARAVGTAKRSLARVSEVGSSTVTHLDDQCVASSLFAVALLLAGCPGNPRASGSDDVGEDVWGAGDTSNGVSDTGSDPGSDDDGGVVMCTSSNNDCRPTGWCDPSVGCREMGACAGDSECAVGHVCNLELRTCACVNDESCAGWPDGRTACDAETGDCRIPRPFCDPPCDTACEDCDADSHCRLKEGADCCSDDDCVVPPWTRCEPNTHQCDVQLTCGDGCISNEDCRDCDTFGFRCVAGMCQKTECTENDGCVAFCDPDVGWCNSGLCNCVVLQGLCGLCNASYECKEGLICGQMSKSCTKECSWTEDCMDEEGTLFMCGRPYGGSTCVCASPSCCKPPCEGGRHCDEIACSCL